PLKVLTLDRVVSLQDYEDYARAFAGIAKALATWSWVGQSRAVFVTVAGPGGADVKPDSDTYKNLLAALRANGDPFVPITVQSYSHALFKISASVQIHPDYRQEKVLVAVATALTKRFS